MTFSRDRPRLDPSTRPRSFEGWSACPECERMIPSAEQKDRFHTCTQCGYHYRVGARERLEWLVDAGSVQTVFEECLPTDPLEFCDLKPYPSRLEEAHEKSGLSEAILTSRATIQGARVGIGVMDFSFLGGSMGSVVGERIHLLSSLCVEEGRALLLICASGGARMQEGVFSLMQMAKTTAAIGQLRRRRLPYISLLTDPTSGGVTASFATLADIIVAEPGALICFTGPRVIEQTMRQKLPKDAQRAESLLQRGLIDAIVPRATQREVLGRYLHYLLPSGACAESHAQRDEEEN